MINLLRSKYPDASEEEILNALNKGAANASAGTMAATGATGILGTLKTAGAGLATVLKPLLPVFAGIAAVFAAYQGFKALDNQFDLTKGTTTKKYETSQRETIRKHNPILKQHSLNMILIRSASMSYVLKKIDLYQKVKN